MTQFSLSIIILACLLFTSLSSAGLDDDFSYTSDSSCSTKRLDVKPGVAEKIPVQDQDGNLMCWAYASAQLIDAWRVAYDQPQPITQFTSPISLGVQYATLTKKPNLVEPDSPINLLTRAKDLYSCSYNVVQDQFNSKLSADFLNELVGYYEQAKASAMSRETAINAIRSCIVNAGFKNTIDIKNISAYLDEQHWIPFTNKLMDNVCENHKKSMNNLPELNKDPENFAKNYRNRGDAKNKMRDIINRRLDKKNPQPIGISYCRSVLNKRDFNGIHSNGTLDKNSCPSLGKNKPHTSVVMGRRLASFTQDGKTQTICQYLIRDSYGSLCDGFPNDPNTVPPEVCEKGQIWVDEDALMRNTAELYYMKDQK